MDLSEIMQRLAIDIDGRFMEYSDENTIITVPVGKLRYQNVTGYLTIRNEKQVVEFMSKVCELRAGINFKALLELNQDLFYGKVIIFEGMLRVAAAALFEHSTEEIIRDMILEVAQAADDLELKLMEADVY
jgi:hypothetical protein